MAYLKNSFLLVSVCIFILIPCEARQLFAADSDKFAANRELGIPTDEDDYNSRTYEDTSYYDVSSEEHTTRWYDDPELTVRTKYRRQYVDQVNRLYSWYQRVYQNTGYWVPGAPIYVYVGSNEKLLESVLTQGLMVELANATGGVLFAVEHRFYGDNKSIADIQYLHSTQALYDLRAVIGAFKREPEYAGSAVVLVGGGYGGALAVWLKKLAPDLIDVVLASSAPLLAKPTREEYFYSAVNSYLKYAPANCPPKIQNLITLIVTCQNNDMAKCLHIYEPICPDENMHKDLHIALYVMSVLNIFAEAAERGIRAMHSVCKKLRDGIYHKAPAPMFWNEEKQCNDYNAENFVTRMNNTENLRKKLWMFQSCNEFGHFMNINNWLAPDGTTYNISYFLRLQLHLNLCGMLFGEKYSKEERFLQKIEDTNNRYGGTQPNVDNVIFTFGALDPWNPFGAAVSYSELNLVLAVKGASHCRDLRPFNRSDPKPIREGKRHLISYVKYLLHEPGVEVTTVDYSTGVPA